jgi:hypothetical protein
MRKLARQEEQWKLFYYFSSHPHPGDRLESMEKVIADSNAQ